MLSCNAKPSIPSFFEVEPSAYKMSEDQVKALNGVVGETRDHLYPRCTEYFYPIHNLTDDSMGWTFSKETNDIVSYTKDYHISKDLLNQELQKLIDRYGKPSEVSSDRAGPYYYEWAAIKNEIVKKEGVYKIEVRIFASFNMVSYSISFLDKDGVCMKVK